MGDARIFRTYRDDPDEYDVYGYSNSKLLARFGRDRRRALHDEARGDEDRATLAALTSAVNKAGDGGSVTESHAEPFPEGQPVELGPNSTILLDQGRLRIDFDMADLDDKFRKAIDLLLKRVADGLFFLPEAHEPGSPDGDAP